jgi:hypothetical protein
MGENALAVAGGQEKHWQWQEIKVVLLPARMRPSCPNRPHLLAATCSWSVTLPKAGFNYHFTTLLCQPILPVQISPPATCPSSNQYTKFVPVTLHPQPTNTLNSYL